MPTARWKAKWLGLGAAAAATALSVWLLTRPAPGGEAADATRDGGGTEPKTPTPASPRAARPPERPAAEAPSIDPPIQGAPEPTSPVDLTALRKAMPENLYWSTGAPTTDEAILKERARTAASRNTAWGKIQAGEATDEEIHQYFEAQRRLHQDYLDFSTAVLDRYGDQLSERDRGLFELGANMHKDRLAELPAREAEAQARRRTQEDARKAWEAAGRPGGSTVPP